MKRKSINPKLKPDKQRDKKKIRVEQSHRFMLLPLITLCGVLIAAVVALGYNTLWMTNDDVVSQAHSTRSFW